MLLCLEKYNKSLAKVPNADFALSLQFLSDLLKSNPGYTARGRTSSNSSASSSLSSFYFGNNSFASLSCLATFLTKVMKVA